MAGAAAPFCTVRPPSSRRLMLMMVALLLCSPLPPSCRVGAYSTVVLVVFVKSSSLFSTPFPSSCFSHGATFSDWLPPIAVVRRGVIALHHPPAVAVATIFLLKCLLVCLDRSSRALPPPFPHPRPQVRCRDWATGWQEPLRRRGVRRDDHIFLFHSSLVRGASGAPADSNRSDPRPLRRHVRSQLALSMIVCHFKTMFHCIFS